jgi:protocatechuate 3,4-dioxygenase beta subunit
MNSFDEGGINRRTSLLKIGGLVATTMGVGACNSDVADSASGPSAVATGAVKCVLTPELTEGPYYIAGEKVRRNITEGHPGTPLALHLSVLDVSSCKAIKGAAVDIWHCDAAGDYSGFSSGGSRTFLRGIQRTDSKGVARFATIYPGWYTGRTVHIHVKVHLGGNVLHTGQLYFPDGVTDAVYRKPPYSSRPNRDVRNADDSIYRNGGKRSQVTLKKNAAGVYVASIAMGVHRS